MRRTWLVGAVAVALGPALLAQAPSRSGSRPVLSRAAEIALARSGAPAAVSDGSRVWVFTGKGYVIADSGTTGVACYVGRPWGGSLEPHCFDPEGARTILPIQMRRVELYAAGKAEAEVEREIADGISSGRFPLPARPAMSYMMSAAQHLITQTGAVVGAWQPHLMIFQPYVTPASIGLVKGGGFLFVENPGQALAAVIVPLREFVAAPDSTRR